MEWSLKVLLQNNKQKIGKIRKHNKFSLKTLFIIPFYYKNLISVN